MGSIGAPDNFRHDGLGVSKVAIRFDVKGRSLGGIGGAALLFVTIAGIIAITTFAPMLGALFAFIVLVDFLTCLILDREIQRKLDQFQPDDNTDVSDSSVGHYEHEVTEPSERAWKVRSFM